MKGLEGAGREHVSKKGDLLEQLRSDPHIKEIQDGLSISLSDYSVPESEDHNEKSYVGSFLDSAIVYLNYDTIVDDFDDHRDRREWRYELKSDLREVYQANRLRINGITPLSGYASLLFTELSEKDLDDGDLLEHLSELISEFENTLMMKKYDDLSIEGKVAFTDFVVEICKDVINELIEEGLVVGNKI